MTASHKAAAAAASDLKRLSDAATPGPWRLVGDAVCDSTNALGSAIAMGCGNTDRWPANRALIVALVNAFRSGALASTTPRAEDAGRREALEGLQADIAAIRFQPDEKAAFGVAPAMFADGAPFKNGWQQACDAIIAEVGSALRAALSRPQARPAADQVGARAVQELMSAIWGLAPSPTDDQRSRLHKAGEAVCVRLRALASLPAQAPASAIQEKIARKPDAWLVTMHYYDRPSLTQIIRYEPEPARWPERYDIVPLYRDAAFAAQTKE